MSSALLEQLRHTQYDVDRLEVAIVGELDKRPKTVRHCALAACGLWGGKWLPQRCPPCVCDEFDFDRPGGGAQTRERVMHEHKISGLLDRASRRAKDALDLVDDSDG